MAAVQQNFTFAIGEDVLETLTVFDPTGTVPQNITGWNMAFYLKLPGGAIFVTKTTGAGMTILAQSGPTLGQVTILFNRADTFGIVQPGYYDFRAERTDAGADAWTTIGTVFLTG